jgi:ribosomal protein L31
MKKDISPRLSGSTVRCACDKTFETGSTRKRNWRWISARRGHPFYTATELVRYGATVERIRRGTAVSF